jgi:hypothetical protein
VGRKHKQDLAGVMTDKNFKKVKDRGILITFIGHLK